MKSITQQKIDTLTPEQIAEILATPGEQRSEYALHNYDSIDVDYPLNDGYSLSYMTGRVTPEDWNQYKDFSRSSELYGEWSIVFPLDKEGEEIGRTVIGLGDDQPDPKGYGGLTFAQALAKARVVKAALEMLPKRTLGDIAGAYYQHLAASGLSDPDYSAVVGDLQFFLDCVGAHDRYFSKLPYVYTRNWRTDLLAAIAGKHLPKRGPKKNDEERARAYVIANRVWGNYMAMCDHAYSAGDSGLDSTPWRAKPLLMPDEKAEMQKIVQERQRRRDIKVRKQVEEYRARQRLHEEAKALGVITDKKSKLTKGTSKPVAYTVQTAAEALVGVPVETVEKWVGNGKLASINVDGIVLIPAAALAALLKPVGGKR